TITGTANYTGPGGFHYALSAAPAAHADDDQYYFPLPQGTYAGSQITSTFDTSGLPNGQYVIRLSLLAGTTGTTLLAKASKTVSVTGELKVGTFSFSETDLSIPFAGGSFDVTRTYDSLARASEGPLGFGWSSGLDLNLQEGAETRSSTYATSQLD